MCSVGLGFNFEMDVYTHSILSQTKKIDRRYAGTLSLVLLSVAFCLTLIFALDPIYELLREPLLSLIEIIDPSPQNENAVRETVSMLTSIILSALAILLPTLPLCLVRHRTPKAVCASPSKKPNVNIFAYIPFAIGMGYFASLAANLLFGETSRFIETEAGFLPSTVLGTILYFVYIAVLPAIAEEIMFRGVIMGALMPYGRTQALVISAVLFGLTHVNPIQAIFATVMGLLIGELYAQTGSIWWGALIHFLNNAISSSVTYLLQIYGEDDIIVLGVFGLVVLAIMTFAIAYGTVLVIRANKKRRLVDLAPPPDGSYRTLRDAAKQLLGRSAYATAMFCAAYAISLISRYYQ